MIEAKIDYSDFNRGLSSTVNNLEHDLLKAFEECGDLIIEEAKKEYSRHFKINTGDAINAIQVDHVSNEGVSVGLDTAVDHAYYLHEGTKNITGHPFLDIGLENSKSKCETIVEKSIEKSIKEAGF